MAILSMSAVQKSLPVWGEWIEIAVPPARLRVRFPSLPVWGEWIEILILRLLRRFGKSLPVWGEWIEIREPTGIWNCSAKVSPRVGRVD